MPLPRKKLKLVESSTTGRNKSRWIKPRIDDNQNRQSNACETPNSLSHNDGNPEEVDLGLGLSLEGSNEEINEGASTASKERKTKTYQEIKKKDVENWAKLRDKLLKTAVERSHPCVECCLKCDTQLGHGLGTLAKNGAGQETAFDSILFRCEDCGPFYYVCFACLLEDHQLRPNHIPEKWNVSCSTLSGCCHFLYRCKPFHSYSVPCRCFIISNTTSCMMKI